MTNEVASAVTSAASDELASALAKIKQCLDQLTQEQVWWRPGEGQNSIANLLLHLAGNLRQWIVVGLGGGEDRRNRPHEFADDSGRPKEELLALVEAAVREAQSVLARQTAADLLRGRRIQGFDISGMRAIFDSVPPFPRPYAGDHLSHAATTW